MNTMTRWLLVGLVACVVAIVAIDQKVENYFEDIVKYEIWIDNGSTLISDSKEFDKIPTLKLYKLSNVNKHPTILKFKMSNHKGDWMLFEVVQVGEKINIFSTKIVDEGI